MLRYRLILGLLFAALFVGLIALDEFLSRTWPDNYGSAPPGLIVALACLIIIPLALREMQRLLARQNVQIAMRVVSVAAILCMLWPWFEQVSEKVFERAEELRRLVAATTAPTTATAQQTDVLQAMQGSVWYTLAQWFRTVKPHYLVPTILTASLVAAFALHSRRQRVEGAMANAGGTLLTIVYLGVLPGFFLPICMTHNAWMVLAIVGIVKAADIGAYIAGSTLGRHKLIPWLSPGKTLEGFFGGLVFSALVGILVARLFPGFTWQQGLIAGVLLGAVGQAGDLLESLLKRDAGVKDSGRVPGFGGILDLLDSPLLAAPVAYWLLKLITR